MRIAIDAHTFSPRQMTGGDVYVANLVREIAAIDSVDAFVVMLNAFSAAARADACRALEDLAGPNFEFVATRVPGRLPERTFNRLYYNVVAPRLVEQHRIDLFFGANFYGITKGPARKVVKVHDIAPLACPEFTRPGQFKAFRRDMLRVTAAADAVLTDTEATRADIVRMLGVPADKVVPIYEAPEPCFGPMDAGRARAIVRQAYQLERPFFLFVGTVQPRKNVANIIRAFDRAKQAHALEHELIIIGKPGWGYEDALRARDESRSPESVRFLGYVPRERVVAFYNAADAFVWPSFYEGIGLPLLEAMACGAPVATSDRGSMKETVADAALLADPNDADAIADCLWRIASDDALRQSLRDKGLARAAQFSWRKTAQQTLGVLRRVGGDA